MAGILSLGWWLPDRRIGVEEWAARNGADAGALRDFGLESITVPGPDDHPAGMAAAAARHALSAARLTPRDVDLLVFCGLTRDYPTPWVAAFGVIEQLGAARANGFDLSARCPGMNDALWTAAQLVRAGTYRTAVVCSGDRFDHILGPPRRAVQLGELTYSAGAAAAVVTAGCDNELAAYAHTTHDDLALHDQNTPRAGGTRAPIGPGGPADLQHMCQNDMSMSQLVRLRQFMRDADRRNLEAVSRAAGWSEIDFFACSPLDVKGQAAALRQLGLDPATQTRFTLPALGHTGPGDLLLGVAAALAEGRRIGPRLVMAARSVSSSNAIAVRGRTAALGIRIDGSPLASAGAPERSAHG
jgi:3-oxoacyl-[acyl-carrier-protein] synthase-3